MASITYKPNFHVVQPCILPPSINLDLLWHVGWFLSDKAELRSSWGGFNSSVVRGKLLQARAVARVLKRGVRFRGGVVDEVP